MTDRPLKLSARDAGDLSVISTMVQDALVRPGDMVFRERERRFLVLLDRFMWERDDGEPVAGKLYRRVRSVLHFDGVLGARSRDLDLGARQEVLALLAVAASQAPDSAPQVDLVFAGGSVVRLDVECVECRLTDRGRPWVTRRRPRHPVDAAD